MTGTTPQDLPAGFTLKHLHRDLTSQELTAITGVPIRAFHAGELPFPWDYGYEVSAHEARRNSAFLRKTLKQDLRDGASPHFRGFNTNDFHNILGLTNQSAISTTLAAPDHGHIFLMAVNDTISGPYTRLLPISLHHTRICGTHSARAGLIMMEPAGWTPRQHFSLYTGCPEELLEVAPATWVPASRQLMQLHEAGHIKQGITDTNCLPDHLKEEWLSATTLTKAETPHSRFLFELDADLYSHHAAQYLGMDHPSLQRGRALRLIHGFASLERRYWFGLHLMGDHPAYEDNLAYYREMHLTTIFTALGRKLPKPDLLTRWANSFAPESLSRNDPDVLTLKRRINRAADDLDKQDNCLARRFSTLGELARHHEFTHPLVQKLATATADSAALFMPKLMGCTKPEAMTAQWA